MSIKLRLVDFAVKNDKEDYFKIQIFGLNKNGETHSIRVSGFNPFFYIKVNKSWTKSSLNKFLKHLRVHLKTKELKKLYNKIEPDVTFKQFLQENLDNNYECKEEMYLMEKKCKLIESKKLYGFDCGKKYKFAKLVF